MLPTKHAARPLPPLTYCLLSASLASSQFPDLNVCEAIHWQSDSAAHGKSRATHKNQIVWEVIQEERGGLQRHQELHKQNKKEKTKTPKLKRYNTTVVWTKSQIESPVMNV